MRPLHLSVTFSRAAALREGARRGEVTRGRPPHDHLGVTVLIDHAAAMVPSVDGIDPAGWLAHFDEMFAEVVVPAFFRREPRLRSRSYLLGLVSGVERKNGWTLAEFAGEATPDGMQRPLNSARWDAGAVRDALGRYVAFHLGDPAAVPAAATSPVTSGIKHF